MHADTTRLAVFGTVVALQGKGKEGRRLERILSYHMGAWLELVGNGSCQQHCINSHLIEKVLIIKKAWHYAPSFLDHSSVYLYCDCKNVLR